MPPLKIDWGSVSRLVLVAAYPDDETLGAAGLLRRATYRVPLAEFRAALRGPDGLSGVQNEAIPTWGLHWLAAVQSLSDPFAKVTIGADRAELSWLLDKPGLEGQCITISVAGHHRVLETRISLTDIEYIAWVQAVLGVAWIPLAYRAGVTTEPAGRTITAYFRLFLDAKATR